MISVTSVYARAENPTAKSSLQFTAATLEPRQNLPASEPIKMFAPVLPAGYRLQWIAPAPKPPVTITPPSMFTGFAPGTVGKFRIVHGSGPAATFSAEFLYTWNSNYTLHVSVPVGNGQSANLVLTFSRVPGQVKLVGSVAVGVPPSPTPHLDQAIQSLVAYIHANVHAANISLLNSLLKSLMEWRGKFRIDLNNPFIHLVSTSPDDAVHFGSLPPRVLGTVDSDDQIVVATRVQPSQLDGLIFHEFLHTQQAFAHANMYGDIAEISAWASTIPLNSPILKRASQYITGVPEVGPRELAARLQTAIAEAYPSYFSRSAELPVIAARSNAAVADELLKLWKGMSVPVTIDGHAYTISQLATANPSLAMIYFNNHADAPINVRGRSTSWMKATLDAWAAEFVSPGLASVGARKLLRRGVSYYSTINSQPNMIAVELESPSPLATDGWAFETSVADRLDEILAAPALTGIDTSPAHIAASIAEEKQALARPGTSAQHALTQQRIDLLEELTVLQATVDSLSAPNYGGVFTRLQLHTANSVTLTQRTAKYMSFVRSAARFSAAAAEALVSPLDIALAGAGIVVSLENNNPEGAASFAAGLVSWPADLAHATNPFNNLPGAFAVLKSPQFPADIKDWTSDDYASLLHPANPLLGPGSAVLNLFALAGAGVYHATLPTMTRLAVAPAPKSAEEILAYNFLPDLKSSPGKVPVEVLTKAFATGLLTANQVRQLTLIAVNPATMSQFWPKLVQEVDWGARNPEKPQGAWVEWVSTALHNYNVQTLHLHPAGRLNMDVVSNALLAVGFKPGVARVILPAAVRLRNIGHPTLETVSGVTAFDEAALPTVLGLFPNSPDGPITGFGPAGRAFHGLEPYIWATFSYRNSVAKGTGVGSDIWVGAPYNEFMHLYTADFSSFALSWLGLSQGDPQTKANSLKTTMSWQAAMLAFQEVAHLNGSLSRPLFAQVLSRMVLSPEGRIYYRAPDVQTYLRLRLEYPNVISPSQAVPYYDIPKMSGGGGGPT